MSRGQYGTALALVGAKQYTSHGAFGRGLYGTPRVPPPTVGSVFMHSIEDRRLASDQISKGFAALQNEVMTAAGWRADPYHPAEGPLWDWWKIAGIPTIEGWQKFQGEQHTSWILGPAFATSWDEYEKWLGLLRVLRDAVRAHGFTLQTPEPVELSTTTVEDVKNLGKRIVCKVTDAGSDVWTLAKVGIYGALGLGAVLAVSSIVSNMKSGKDPAEKYFALAQRKRV